MEGEMFCHKKIVVILIAGRVYLRACVSSNCCCFLMFGIAKNAQHNNITSTKNGFKEYIYEYMP